MLDVVIVADFCNKFDKTINNRFVYLSSLLLKEGHKVEIITSDFYHGTKTKFSPFITEYEGATVTMLHESPYSKNISIKRFLSHYWWGKRVGKYLKKRKKPDVIYCAIPTLKAAKETGRFCKKNGVKFIIDIQDLWPEAFKMVFNVPFLSSLLFFPFRCIANSAYRMADEIVAVSQTYVNRALKVNKKVKEGHSIFLGTDLEQFDKNVLEPPVIKKNQCDYWLGYCGTLGSSYDLKIVFDAMKLLNNSSLVFVVMGDGPRRKEFELYSKDLRVLFTGMLPYPKMCSLLAQCDIVVNPITHNAAQSIINKHADYAAAGKPVLSTQESPEYQSLIDHYEMGFNITNNDSALLAAKISWLLSSKENMIKMGRNSRNCAEDVFDRNKTYKVILSLINKL